MQLTDLQPADPQREEDDKYRFAVQCAGRRDHKYTASYVPDRCAICGGRVKVTDRRMRS